MEAMTLSSSGTDGELLRQARNGHPEAFAVLVDRHKDPLVNYLTKLAGTRDRAEDLAQEAFLRLFERGESYDERGLLRAYLFRIATNLLRSQERRKSRWGKVLSLFLSSDGGSHEAMQEERLLRHEIQENLRRAIASLPLHYRAPLVLHEIDGWRYQEIGEALGCREGTVKSRIHRGRRLLREQLEPYWKGTAS
jgi:RNA polymerase sigma-70 factor (ECF subfamily)